MIPPVQSFEIMMLDENDFVCSKGYKTPFFSWIMVPEGVVRIRGWTQPVPPFREWTVQGMRIYRQFRESLRPVFQQISRKQATGQSVVLRSAETRDAIREAIT
jgi:hypothetical protein